MPTPFYLIDSDLHAAAIEHYLSPAGTDWDRIQWPPGASPGVVGFTAGPGLPVTPDGELVPDALYPSSTDPRAPFYLPRYQLTYALGFVAGGGRYIVGLHWRGPHDDPNGPLAFLTLSFTLYSPGAVGATPAEIPHQAIARLGYKLPVQGVPAPAPPRPVDAFLGVWRNIEPFAQGLVRLEIQPKDDHRAALHAFWTGNPQYTGGPTTLPLHLIESNGFMMPDPQHVDLGTVEGIAGGDTMVGSFVLGFGHFEINMTLRRDGARLTAQVVRRSLAGGSQPAQTDAVVLAGGPDDGRPLQWVEIGALTTVSPVIRTARLAIADKRDFDRIYQVMTDPKYDARVEVRTFARAARRTWRQIVVDKVALATQVDALREKRLLVTEVVPPHRPVPIDPPDPAPDPAPDAVPVVPAEHLGWTEAVRLVDTPVHLLIDPVQSPALSPAAAHLVATHTIEAARLSPALFAIPESPALAALAPPPDPPDASAAAREELVVAPSLGQAFSPPLAQAMADTDVETQVDDASVQKAVPLSALLGDDGRPALIEIQVESRQEVYPFCFPPGEFGYVYDLPPGVAPGADHVLIRREVRDGAGQVVGVFYQDSAYTDQVYYQPQEFRLARADAAPYLPDLRVVFYELATADGAGGAIRLNYKVRLGYRVVPHVEPHVLDLARQQFADVKAVFDALPASSTRLSLRVPRDATGGALAELPRPDIQVRLDQAVVDEIELSRTEFERVFAFFESPSGDGLDGDVDATLPGSQTTRVPVRLSLRQTAGDVFGHTYLGPQGNGVHRVRLVNRVESPARVEALFRVALGGGAFAYPQTAAGQVVPPGGQLDLDFKADPVTAAVVDLDPEIEVSVDADPRKLWPLLFINQGYASDTFDLKLSIDPGFFGAPPPAPPLTGVRVAFDDGTVVTLAAARLAATVSLRIPLLPRLMNDPQAKQYRYRVTNLLGPDAHAGPASDWVQGIGDAPLTVTPAGA